MNDIQTNSENDVLTEEWDDEQLNLKDKLLRGIYAFGFEHPSPIQKRGLYPMIYSSTSGKHRDLIAQAQS